MTAVGDQDGVSVGLMAVGKEFNADQTTVEVDHADLWKAPVGPVLQTWVLVQLMPGQSRNFTFALSVAKSAGSWDAALIKPVVNTLMDPYKKFFQTTCETPALPSPLPPSVSVSQPLVSGSISGMGTRRNTAQCRLWRGRWRRIAPSTTAAL